MKVYLPTPYLLLSGSKSYSAAILLQFVTVSLISFYGSKELVEARVGEIPFISSDRCGFLGIELAGIRSRSDEEAASVSFR